MIVNATFQVADAIVLLAFLGFLGFGLPYPAVDWGDMLSGGLTYLQDGYWWLVYPVGGCLVLVVMAFNFIGALGGTPSTSASGGGERLSPPVLEVDDLSTHIQLSHSVVHAVGNVSFRIEPGETLGLVGESACGKSMTALSIMRLLPGGGHIVGGSIRLEGRDLVGLSEPEMREVRGNEVAMIFQDSLTSLNPTMPIGEQIAEPVRLHRGASKAAALDRATEVLGLVGFPRPRERLDDYPHQLSGGQRQRVMIAIALSCEPKLLIADEPTTALDVTIQAQILRLLDDLKERLGMAVLLITHDMGVVAGRADRVSVMYAGRLVESAPTDQVFRHMHHPYTQGLLGSIPLLTQERNERLYSIPGIPVDLTEPPVGCRFAARCRFAADDCWSSEPRLAAGGGTHAFACWHPVDGPVDRHGLAIALEEADGTESTNDGAADDGAESGAYGFAAVVRAATNVAAAPDGSDRLLVLEDVVLEYPVTAGAVLQRRVGSVKAVSGVSFTVGHGETFGWSASQDAARPRSARSSSGLNGRTPGVPCCGAPT